MNPDDEWLDLGARVAVGCSEPVRIAMRATVAATQVFESARTGWHLERDGHMPPSPPGEPSARQKMDDARRVAIEAVREAQTEMRDELES
jgi:hypothetical protein